MSQEIAVKKGSWVFRTLKILTVAGVVYALGRVALSFLKGEEALEDPDPSGV